MYFDRFAPVYFNVVVNGRTETRLVRDITTNVRFRKELLSNVTLFDQYDVQDGETPDIIAAKIYGNPQYHWVIMLANDRFDWRKDMPFDDQSLRRYLTAKYGDQINDVHHYENADGLVVMSDAAGATPVTNYEYEVRLNESKRRIKIIAPELLSSILAQFKSVM